MKIILSTRNPSKAEQIKALFNDPSIVLETLDEAGISGEAIEDGSTLEENAFKKALYAYEKAGGNCWTMADDTGLYINALNGEPGIKAARWIGDATTNEITQYCLKRLENITDRNAYFETAVVIIDPNGSRCVFTGRIDGTIRNEALVPPQPKMPYSPLFVPSGQTKCWAEMTTDEENTISHRGQAFRKVLKFLQKQ